MLRLLSLLLIPTTLVLSGCAKQRDDTPRVGPAPPARGLVIARLAPDFGIRGASIHNLRGLRGQAVVLIVADSPHTRAFRKQLSKLDEGYAEFASREAVFVA